MNPTAREILLALVLVFVLLDIWANWLQGLRYRELLEEVRWGKQIPSTSQLAEDAERRPTGRGEAIVALFCSGAVAGLLFVRLVAWLTGGVA